MPQDTPTERTALVAALIVMQAELGESDQTFAARLGISRRYWSRLRRGERIGAGGLHIAVARTHPHLAPLIGAPPPSAVTPEAVA